MGRNEILSFAFERAFYRLSFDILDFYMRLILFLDGSILEKIILWKNGRFSRRLQLDWGNTARASTAGLGSKGVTLEEFTYISAFHIFDSQHELVSNDSVWQYRTCDCYKRCLIRLKLKNQRLIRVLVRNQLLNLTYFFET